ncbi:hypothetical protein Dda_2081 [Drechslerella dactyloides]|uniref:Uncharacterized protein n=1 Tax=Drechslerella dactyloides TaxID=74499 RepID=A0AAD6J721_DREDA|nr:hypothetical protein Dda_2081 [Drechslerella dactyloides]
MVRNENGSEVNTEPIATANRGPFTASTKEKPRDLAPGLRPRPHPDVPKLILGMGGEAPPPPPPPPPPPGPPPPPAPIPTPLQGLKKSKSKDLPQTPKKLVGQGDVMEELKARLASRGTPQSKGQFVEPVRIVPKTPPSLADQLRAELPSGMAKLKPIGSKARNWMKMEQDAQKEREDSLKKEIRPPRTPIEPKQPPLPPILETRHNKPLEPSRPPTPKTFKPVRYPKPPEPVPVEEKVDKAQELDLEVPRQEAVNVEVSTRGEACRKEAVEPDFYLVWSIRIIGVVLIVCALLKIELYLWVIAMATTLGLEDLL